MLRCPVLIVLWILQLLRELQKVLICRPSNRKLTRQHVNMTVHISNYKEKKQSDVHTYIYYIYYSIYWTSLLMTLMVMALECDTGQ